MLAPLMVITTSATASRAHAYVDPSSCVAMPWVVPESSLPGFIVRSGAATKRSLRRCAAKEWPDETYHMRFGAPPLRWA
jgi:hypothetical protein